MLCEKTQKAEGKEETIKFRNKNYTTIDTFETPELYISIKVLLNLLFYQNYK